MSGRFQGGVIRRESLERLLWYATIVAPILCLALVPVVYFWLGSCPAARFLALYVAPMALVTPWWIRERVRRYALAGPGQLVPGLIDASVLLLALARFGIGETLPFSGHMLFLTYSALTTLPTRYRLVAVALIVETTIFKLWLWQDERSWSIGLAVGLLAALLHEASTRPAI